MPTEVKLSPNVPLQLALADPSGVPEDFRVHYALSDGRVLTLPRQAAIELNRLDLRPGEAFCICRDVSPVVHLGTQKATTYRVWLPSVKERAAEEAETEGTGTYGLHYEPWPMPSTGNLPQQVPIPEPLPAEIRASGPIPMNVAFREVTAFVTAELKAAGEQWTDQAKQDIVSTVLISAAKKGWLKVWER